MGKKERKKGSYLNLTESIVCFVDKVFAEVVGVERPGCSEHRCVQVEYRLLCGCDYCHLVIPCPGLLGLDRV